MGEDQRAVGVDHAELPEEDAPGDYFDRHLARAAFFAIAFLLVADSFSALAFPPLAAPSLPSATAAGFLVSGSGAGGGRLPVARITVRKALRLTSRSFGFLLARDGIE